MIIRLHHFFFFWLWHPDVGYDKLFGYFIITSATKNHNKHLFFTPQSHKQQFWFQPTRPPSSPNKRAMANIVATATIIITP